MVHSYFSNFSYYIILALVLAWCMALIRAADGRKAVDVLRSHKKSLFLTFLVSSLIFCSVPIQHRVLSDETNLLSVSRAMTFERRVDNITEGRWYYGMFWPTKRSIEKRPFLFPFFTHILHQTFGYHPVNAFVLNYFVLWALLFSVYVIIAGYLGQLWACAGIVLLAAQPMVSLNATSGGYELFNTLFIAFGFLSLRRFLRSPSGSSFSVLLFTLLMLANIRYESGIFLAMAMLFLGFGGYIRRKYVGSGTVLACAVFLLPLIMQRALMAGVPDSNLMGGGWLNAFRLEYAAHNITALFHYIFDFSGRLGYAGLVNSAGCLVLGVYAFLFLSGRKKIPETRQQLLFAISLGSLLVWLGIVISYQGGVDDHPMNGRLYLPLLVLLSVFPVTLLAELSKGRDSPYALYALAAAIMAFMYYHPIAMEDRLTSQLSIIREERFVRDFLREHGDKNILVICGRPGQLIVDRYGAVSFNTANREKNVFWRQYKNHLYDTIYAVQSISYKTKSPLKDNVLDAAYQLKPVASLQITGGYFLQISRVKM